MTFQRELRRHNQAAAASPYHRHCVADIDTECTKSENDNDNDSLLPMSQQEAQHSVSTSPVVVSDAHVPHLDLEQTSQRSPCRTATAATDVAHGLVMATPERRTVTSNGARTVSNESVERSAAADHDHDGTACSDDRRLAQERIPPATLALLEDSLSSTSGILVTTTKTTGSKPVSLASSTDTAGSSSLMDSHRDDAISVEANHTGEPASPSALSITTNTGASSSLSSPMLGGIRVEPQLEVGTEASMMQEQSEASPYPSTETSTNTILADSASAPTATIGHQEDSVLQNETRDDGYYDDSIVCEQVEIKWTTAMPTAAAAAASDAANATAINMNDVANLAVEHSFRAPTPKRAWGSSTVTPVDRIPYVHGSFASAAPMLMYNRKWMRILKKLMPANHADAVEILREAEEARSRRSPNDFQMAKLMKWAENNPVVAAYGMLKSNCGADADAKADAQPQEQQHHQDQASSTTTTENRSVTRSAAAATYSPLRFGRKRRQQEPKRQNKSIPVLEWDVFLDPTLVKKVDAAMDIVERLKEDDCAADDQDQVAADIEVDRQVGRLINRMMLAHGSASHLVSEALGVASQYNFTKLVEQGESQRLYRRKEAEKKWKRSGLHFSRNGSDVGGKKWLVREQAHGSLMNFDSHRRPSIAGKASAKPAGIFVERWLALFLSALHIAKATEGALPSGHFYLEDDESTPQVEAEALQTGRPPMCGVFLCLGIEDPNAGKVDHAKTTMASTAAQIEESLGSPLRVILDLKSRRVPARVWARVIDNMRSRGLLIEGLGSFDIDELRSVKALCASNVTDVRFFHSAGDLQKACHAKEVNIGDTVFFNAGSLLWEKPNKISNVVCGNPDVSEAVADDDGDEDEHGVRFQPFAFPRNYRKDEDTTALQVRSTLQEYKDKFKLNIGCYVQEFSISDKNLDALTRFLNKFKSVYNLGLAWGGLNGQCHEGLHGDGYWNQRYIGRAWDYLATPEDMRLLQPEDHPMVQRAMLAGAWGSIATLNYIGQEDLPETQAMQLGARAMETRPTCG